MNFLEERILKDGVVREGNVLKVDSFLNHQMDISLMEKIGAELGGRNHATVVYAIRKVEKQMKEDPRFKAIVEDIIKNCQQ